MSWFKKNEIEDCCKICDFCKFYHYNGIDLVSKDEKTGKIKIIERAIYTYEGYCGLDGNKMDPADDCPRWKEKKYSIFRIIWVWWYWKTEGRKQLKKVEGLFNDKKS